MLRIILAALALLAGCGAEPGVSSDDVEETPPFLRDSSFELAPMDTGNIADACSVLAPWGNRSWGAEASTFSDSTTHAIDGARFASTGHQVYFYGKEMSGRWGFVRYVQGSMWGATNCGPIPWNVPAPLETYGHELTFELDVYRDASDRLSTFLPSWTLVAINLWFSTPDMPEPGRDKNRRKPLVMDLAVYNDCNWPFCGLRNFTDDDAYHYQAQVGEAPLNAWGHISFTLSEHLAKAIEAFDLPEAAARTMKLYQVEFLIELHHAEASASFDNFRLEVR